MDYELPNYFLADLPPEATLTEAMIRDACETLRRNRDRYFGERSTSQMVDLIAHVAECWLEEHYPIRRIALELGPAQTGFSRETIQQGIDPFFRRITEQSLNNLLHQEFGSLIRLDRFTASNPEAVSSRQSMAIAPGLLVHVTAGNLPLSGFMSMISGLLLRSAQFVKCSRSGSFLQRLLAHSIYATDPKAGTTLELAAWPADAALLARALFESADCVTATGSDDSVAAIRSAVPAGVRFVSHGHRVSFGFVSKESLSGFGSKKVVARAARDVAAWDQQGCLSPHVFYVEDGTSQSAEQFGEILALELQRIEEAAPRGPVTVDEAADIAGRRSMYEVRAAHLPGTKHWSSEGSTAWTVILEAEPAFQHSCLNRFIYVKPVPSLERALQAAEMVRGQVSTVGVAAPPERYADIATRLARWGVTRICPLGQMQEPPLTWRHDGRPVLSDLVTWSDLESQLSGQPS